MKKLLILSMTFGMLLPVESSAEALTSSAAPSEVKEAKIVKRKRKARGYRKKKGFMWGLFRKNDCGCPKH
ncbi:hypothetical protein [Tellurirhabdus rosea]|uniref:hypothetical protein n=1 Tax=Tellurirhabdus rosea TaxID=2674997 RepID=UPI0022507E2B|nr:hypothetical protein [Tellurirhabdus rosea]